VTVGLDIGTSFIVSSREAEDGIQYKKFRDAFFKLIPPTKIAATVIEKSLKNRSYFKDADGSFVIVGDEAIEKAVERHQLVRQPLFRGVISPREPEARKVLKFILSEVLGEAEETGERLVYSVPAEPIDQSDEEFNTGFHQDVLKRDLGELGFSPLALNEAEAICYAELEDSEYTGICLSFGMGMVNTCVMSDGEALVRFSTTKSGSWIDRMTAQSTGQPDSVVQLEKENGDFVVGQDSDNPILSVVSAYYIRLIDYTLQNLALRVKRKDLPKFARPVPLVVSGGTSLATGFIDAFSSSLKSVDFPFQIETVRHASEPLFAVAKGCLLAASIL